MMRRFKGLFLLPALLAPSLAFGGAPLVSSGSPSAFEDMKEKAKQKARELPGRIPGLSSYDFNPVSAQFCRLGKYNALQFALGEAGNFPTLNSLKAARANIDRIDILQYDAEQLAKTPKTEFTEWGDHSEHAYNPQGRSLLVVITFTDSSTFRIHVPEIAPETTQRLYTKARWGNGPLLKVYANLEYFDDVLFRSKGSPTNSIQRFFSPVGEYRNASVASVTLDDLLAELGSFEYSSIEFKNPHITIPLDLEVRNKLDRLQWGIARAALKLKSSGRYTDVTENRYFDGTKWVDSTHEIHVACEDYVATAQPKLTWSTLERANLSLERIKPFRLDTEGPKQEPWLSPFDLGGTSVK